MQLYIYKGNRPSVGATNLKNNLRAMFLRSEGSTYTGRRASAIINWGSHGSEAARLQQVALRAGRQFLNPPQAVQKATDKLQFFQIMQNNLPQYTVPWCTDLDDAGRLVEMGGRVYARTILNSHSGRGIHLMVSNQDADREFLQRVVASGSMPVFIQGENALPIALRQCRLFTLGIAGKRTEFRIHVVKRECVLVQQKRRSENWGQNPHYNSIVRNVQSSWIYAVNDVQEEGKEAAISAAIETVRTLGLDFGAVDIVYKHDTEKAFVLEVNTAPGLDQGGSALTAYTEAFLNV